MSNQQPTSPQFTESDYEVRYDSFHESDIAGGETRNVAFYERLAELKIAGGTHFLRAGSLDTYVDMLVQDCPLNEHVREAVVMLDSLVHYYAFDIIRGDMMRISRDLQMNRRGNVVESAMTPVYVLERNEEFSEVTRCVGEEYQRWLGNRIVGLDLLSDESIAPAFLEETEIFMKDTRIHSKPEVIDRVVRTRQS